VLRFEILTVCGIGVGLAADALAVSAVCGGVYKQLGVKHGLRMALFFGAFQAFMPIIGWAASESFKGIIAPWDHWVAFALLAGVGGKMIYESFTIERIERTPQDPSKLTVLLALSVATSIDALAVGITLSLITESIFTAVALIGLITFVISYIGWEVGRRVGHLFEKKLEIAGGAILIGIGIKILLNHLLG